MLGTSSAQVVHISSLDFCTVAGRQDTTKLHLQRLHIFQEVFLVRNCVGPQGS